ncbi:MAG: AMP-binding protein, partial [Rhodocyclaceae bacterium]|nr:AMP-binding protein [Rhodocyclaceae bacterium]
MERIWLSSYPPGVPAEVDLNEFSSLVDLFERSVGLFTDRPAYVSMGKTISFGDLNSLTRDFAAYCQDVLGLARGARVALMMPNLHQYPIALFGALRAGCTVVNCNPLYTPRELEHQLKDSGTEAIIIVENFARTLQEVLPRTPVR